MRIFPATVIAAFQLQRVVASGMLIGTSRNEPTMPFRGNIEPLAAAAPTLRNSVARGDSGAPTLSNMHPFRVSQNRCYVRKLRHNRRSSFLRSESALLANQFLILFGSVNELQIKMASRLRGNDVELFVGRLNESSQVSRSEVREGGDPL